MPNRIIASRFRQALKQSGMTKYALAQETKLTATYIRRWEDGKVTNPGFATVIKIATALEVPPLWLMGMDNTGPLPRTSEQETRTGLQLVHGILSEDVPDISMVMHAWAALPPEQGVLIANLIRLSAWQTFAGPVDMTKPAPDELADKVQMRFKQRARARVLKQNR